MSPAADVQGSLLDYALTCGSGLTVFRARKDITTDTASSFSMGLIFKRGDSYKIVSYDMASDNASVNRIISMDPPTWSGWEHFALKNDLTDYFNNTAFPSHTSDCNNCTNIISFIDSNTTHTPYAQEKSGSTEGLLITIKPIVSGVFNAQFVLVNGQINNKRIWCRHKAANESWGNWAGIA